MKNLLYKTADILTGHRSKPKVKLKPQCTRPEFETLEDRTVMSSYIDYWGDLVIVATNASDTVTVNKSGSYYRVTENGYNRYFYSGSTWGGDVRFYGYGGNDFFSNNVSALRTIAYGHGGNDTMYGDAKNDYLYGGDGNDYLNGWTGNDMVDGQNGNDYVKGYSGNDTLYGGSGYDTMLGGDHNDKLYGEGHYDYLYGENGNDFLDDGSGYEYTNGGTGYDFNAHRWAVYGSSYTDIYQGGSPSCWVVAGISAVAQSGVNLASRISYLGYGQYRVKLFDTAGNVRYQTVQFDGDTNWGDAKANPSQEGESWVVITQRAIFQQMGVNWRSPATIGSGNTRTPMQLLTGRPRHYSRYVSSANSLEIEDFTQIQQALSQGRAVTALTYDTISNAPSMVNDHWYVVTGIFYNYATRRYEVVLRNPWGSDGGSTTYGANDGTVVIAWSEFARIMEGYEIN